MILLEDFRPGSLHPDLTDGSAPEVKDALVNGAFYVWKPSEQYNRRSFNLIDVRAEEGSVTLTVDDPDRVTEVQWRTYDREAGRTVTLHRGFEIGVSQVPPGSRFVRAELESAEGTIYTQPIYLR